jgi:selenide,water dikinase
MSTLNDAASQAMVRVGVNACVDVTGFGLVGHLREMAEGSGVGARVSVGRIPVLDGVRELLDRGVAPGGTRRNLSSADPEVAWGDDLDSTARLLLCDAQTSGGLLMAVAPDALDGLLAALERHGVATRAVVGEVLEQPSASRLLEVTP